jgi:hypothetical protein
MTIPAIVPEDLDGDRDDDLEQRAWSEDEKQEILRRARDNIAQGEDEKQEILRRDGDLDEQRTWSDDERREILRRARENIGRRDDEKQEILRRARDNIARRDATGLTRKVKEDARQSPERYKRRRSEGSADDVADTFRAHFDPVRRTAWPQPEPPMGPRRLDASLDDLVAAHVETAFARQHDYILEVMATALAESVCKERRQYRRDLRSEVQYRRDLRSEVRELQLELSNLQGTLAELREVMALERAKTLDLPNPLTLRRSNLN